MDSTARLDIVIVLLLTSLSLSSSSPFLPVAGKFPKNLLSPFYHSSTFRSASLIFPSYSFVVAAANCFNLLAPFFSGRFYGSLIGDGEGNSGTSSGLTGLWHVFRQAGKKQNPFL